MAFKPNLKDSLPNQLEKVQSNLFQAQMHALYLTEVLSRSAVNHAEKTSATRFTNQSDALLSNLALLDSATNAIKVSATQAEQQSADKLFEQLDQLHLTENLKQVSTADANNTEQRDAVTLFKNIDSVTKKESTVSDKQSWRDVAKVSVFNTQKNGGNDAEQNGIEIKLGS